MSVGATREFDVKVSGAEPWSGIQFCLEKQERYKWNKTGYLLFVTGGWKTEFDRRTKGQHIRSDYYLTEFSCNSCISARTEIYCARYDHRSS